MAVILIWSLLIISALLILQCCLRGKFKIISMFFMSAPGISAILLLNLTAQYTGIFLPINFYNLITALFLGLPGVAGLAISGFLR